jgi:hypothetical protein
MDCGCRTPARVLLQKYQRNAYKKKNTKKQFHKKFRCDTTFNFTLTYDTKEEKKNYRVAKIVDVFSFHLQIFHGFIAPPSRRYFQGHDP